MRYLLHFRDQLNVDEPGHADVTKSQDFTFNTSFDSQQTRARDHVSFKLMDESDNSFTKTGKLVWSYAAEHTDYRPSKDMKTLTEIATTKRQEQTARSHSSMKYHQTKIQF